jgi:hypothetical protein
VTLRDVGGDEEGSLKSETVKHGLESQGAQTRARASSIYEKTKDKPVLSSERALHENKTVTVKQ